MGGMKAFLILGLCCMGLAGFVAGKPPPALEGLIVRMPASQR